MSNPFYDHTTVPEPYSKASSSAIRSEFSRIEVGFESVNAALSTGRTYTGTHNFTGATITVPTKEAGSSGNDAASLDFVNGLSFQSALPGQTGNAGKLVITDGGTASWGSLHSSNLLLAELQAAALSF